MWELLKSAGKVVGTGIGYGLAIVSIADAGVAVYSWITTESCPAISKERQDRYRYEYRCSDGTTVVIESNSQPPDSVSYP
jgi:hypothetical protein